MGILDELLGGGQRQKEYKDFLDRYDQGDPSEGYSDQEVLERYGEVSHAVPPDQFGEVATWLSVHRAGLTIFAHASTGDDLADHSRNVIWFGDSEPLNLSIFG